MKQPGYFLLKTTLYV